MSALTIDSNVLSALVTPVPATPLPALNPALVREAEALAALLSVPAKVTTIAPRKPRKSISDSDSKPTYAMTVAERKARYASNRKFWEGPATKRQTQRVADAWEDVPANLRAWEAAELHAEAQAQDHGVKFTTLYKDR